LVERNSPEAPPLARAAWSTLKSAGALFDDLGMRCFVFGNGADDEEYVRDAGKVASPISQADFVLARGLSSMLGHGPDLLRQPAVPYSIAAEEEVLQAAMARRPGGLPLLVANPDLIRPDGQDSPMPGQLAYRYQALGATDVRLVGKPHKLIYERCRSLLARAGLGRDARVAAVGDSLHHDVLGAARKRVARRLREIVEEFELLCLDDTDDRDYFKHVLMHPPVVMTPPEDATVVVSPGDISAACAWLLHDRMGIDVAELYEIFEELLVDR
jgi:hypothetical protein